MGLETGETGSLAFGDRGETGCVALETGDTGSLAFGDIVETGRWPLKIRET